MKTIQKSGLAVMMIAAMFFVTMGTVGAQTTNKTVKIKTSAVCGMCKDRIEKALSFEKGVKSVTLDVPTKVVSVVYDEKKITVEKIRLAISKTGYDADDVKADVTAYGKLPACCKSGKPCTHEGH